MNSMRNLKLNVNEIRYQNYPTVNKLALSLLMSHTGLTALNDAFDLFASFYGCSVYFLHRS